MRQQLRSLKQLAAAKMVLVAVCRTCNHAANLFPAELAEKHGEETKAYSLEPKLRCSQCGSSQPRLYGASR